MIPQATLCITSSPIHTVEYYSNIAEELIEAGAKEREVYLPVGEWKNIHNGEIISGGKYITANAPIDIIPVYEKI